MNPVKQPKNEQLFNNLQTLHLRYPKALFPSESESAIEPVKLFSWWLLFVKREKDGYEQQILNGAIDSAESAIEELSQGEVSKAKTKAIHGYRGLIAYCNLMLKQDTLVAIKRKVKPGVYSVQVLAYFRWYHVGIRFNLVET